MAPYRWTWRTIGENLSHYWWDFRNGVRNLWRFKRAVWNFRSWDYTGMLGLLEESARQMEDCQRRGSHHRGSGRCAKQLMTVKALCKRLSDDDYFQNAGYGDGSEWDSVPGSRKSLIAKHSGEMAKQDAIYLGRMFKFVQHWWD